MSKLSCDVTAAGNDKGMIIQVNELGQAGILCTRTNNESVKK